MQSEKEQTPQEKIDPKNATSNEEKKAFDFKVNNIFDFGYSAFGSFNV